MKNQSKSIIKLLFINLFLISCTNNKPTENLFRKDKQVADEGPLLVFDLKEMPGLSNVKLSEIGAIEIKYIPLKTTSRSVISQINNIIFCNSYFLTYDYTSVNMFNYDGSFVTEVGIKGRGPNEYLGVADVDLNPENESIYIASGEKFLVYTKNGGFLRTFKNPQKSDSKNFKFTEDGILCYYFNNFGNIEYSYILMDTTGKVIKEYPNRYPWKRKGPGVFYQGENIFYKFDSQLFKKEIYCDTIFSFKDKIFEPHMVIDVGEQRLTPEIRSKFRTSPDFSENAYKNYITPWNLFEFSDFIYYEMILVLNGTENLYSFIGSKRYNFRAMAVPEQGLNDDLYGGPDFWPRTIKGDSIIVSWIEALKFREYIASDAFKESNPKFPEKKRELEKLANSLKETDNPVLVMVRLKK
ncbi:MAG: 6-bladed beta-propeller [Bacteroidales bacterium]|nr:6-bladed beta-propeller [Bacteroidales bacterium]